MAPVVKLFGGHKFSVWDRIEIRGCDPTVAALRAYMHQTYGFTTDMVGFGNMMLYASWMQAAKRAERENTHFALLIALVRRKPLALGCRFLTLELNGSINGDEVEVPTVLLWL